MRKASDAIWNGYSACYEISRKTFEVAEMSMLRFTLGLTRKEKVRNKRVREVLGMRRFGEKAREWRLRWCGHVRRRKETYVGQRMLGMQSQGRKQRGRLKRRFMNSIKEYMRVRTVRRRYEEPGEVETTYPCGDP